MNKQTNKTAPNGLSWIGSLLTVNRGLVSHGNAIRMPPEEANTVNLNEGCGSFGNEERESECFKDFFVHVYF